MPSDKKLELKDEHLQEKSLKRTMTKMLTFFHPDKNSNEERKIQILREEITKLINDINE